MEKTEFKRISDEQDSIRKLIFEKLSDTGWSVRFFGFTMGINPMTLGNFLKGKNVQMKNLIKMQNWLDVQI